MTSKIRCAATSGRRLSARVMTMDGVNHLRHWAADIPGGATLTVT